MCEAPIKMQKKKAKVTSQEAETFGMQFFQAESLHPRPLLQGSSFAGLLGWGLKQAGAGTATYGQKRLCVPNSNLIRSPGA